MLKTDEKKAGRIAVFAGGVLFWSSLGEYLGQRYGLFFVKYHYIASAWWHPFGELIPVLVPLLWLFFMSTCWWVSGRYAGGIHARGARSAALMVAIDLVLDPWAVGHHLWEWESSGWWFGIPSENYLAWYLGTTIALYHIYWMRGQLGRRWGFPGRRRWINLKV